MFSPARPRSSVCLSVLGAYLEGAEPQPPSPLNDAPGMKARSYSLALRGLDVGAWRRPPNAVVRSQNLRNLY